MKQILNKLKQNKKLLIPITSILLLIVLLAGVSFAVFNYSNDNAGNNGINSGHISMAYTEPSNEYVVENALPMTDEEGKNSSNYFEFSVTTTAPTNDTDDNGVSIPYEISITESEDNTLINDKIKMYVTEVEGEKELDHTLPTLVSYFEPSLYKDGQIKVGFNLHLHRNGNETITTKYRLRAWIDNNVDVSDWDTVNKYQYKFKVNVNGEAQYQGYETNPSCFAYEKNANGNYSITGYDFSKCGSKNIVAPTSILKESLKKEILALNWLPDNDFLELYKNMMISDGFCDDYGSVTTEEDWEGCLTANGTDKAAFNQETLTLYSDLKSQYDGYVGQNYYDYEEELEEPVSIGLLTVDLSEEKTIINHIKIDTIKSFANTTVKSISNEKDFNTINDLNNVVGKYKTDLSTIANETPIINGLIIPEEILITNNAFSTIKINKLVDRKGNFPLSCFKYASSSDAITITDYLCQGVKNLRILSNINNLPVTTIGNYAFSGNQLTSVIIPDSVTSIEGSAFYKNQLTNVIVPDGVTTIGDGAFTYNQLTEIVIPDSVKYLSGFQDNKLTNIIIPDGVETIGKQAFQGNKLTNLVIPTSVTAMENLAFAHNNLKYVTTPDILYQNDVFLGNKITKIETHDNKFPFSCLRYSKKDNSVSINMFRCRGIINVDIPKEIDGLPVTKIGENAFNYLKNEDGYKNYYHDQLASVTIPDTVTTLNSYAFANNQLTSIDIPNGVKLIPHYIFQNNKLTNVTIPDGVTLINDYAFDGNQLMEVTIPSSVTAINRNAFSNNQLTSIIIPNGVETIGYYAFAYNRLTLVTIPSSVTEIVSGAFLKDNDSNPGLIKINNKTGRAFEWNDVIDGAYSQYYNGFVTGTVINAQGNVEIVAE